MNPYKTIDKIENWKNSVLIISTIITFTLNINEKSHFLEPYGYNKTVSTIIIGFNAVLVVAYIFFEITINFIFQKAEGNRILRYIDNSFLTNYSAAAIPQSGYFSQDNLSPGLYKMCINSFENTLFTFKIAKRMEAKRYIKAFIVFLVFIFTATVGDSGTIRYLTDAILPLALVQDAIKFYFYSSKVEAIHANFASFFTSLNGNMSNFSSRHSEALKLVITYETTLAWSSIKLNSNIYEELNPTLSQEWELLKQQYNIN